MPPSTQVFISHFAGESKIAEELHNFLQDSFPTINIFRSSDAHSIETAEGQYAAILKALATADMMIVLLSSESARRPWMPFETGFAIGRKLQTFTLLVRGARPSDLPSPFREMQLRPIDDSEVEKLLSTIESLSGNQRAPAAVKALLRGLAQAELALPNAVLKLDPYMINQGCMSFRLYYAGHEQLNIRTICAGIPLAAKDPHWTPDEVNGHLETTRRKIEDVDYLFRRYWAGSPAASLLPVGGHLRVITPEVYPPQDDSKDLFELRFALNPDIDVFQDRFLIRCWVETTTIKTPEQVIPMSQIVR